MDPVAAANAAADITEPTLIRHVRAGAGVADLDVRIDGISRWRATAEVAETFRDGRVFLAGDAAHVMPPNGGFGGNTGVHDAQNLAWKLGIALKGRAGPTCWRPTRPRGGRPRPSPPSRRSRDT